MENEGDPETGSPSFFYAFQAESRPLPLTLLKLRIRSEAPSKRYIPLRGVCLETGGDPATERRTCN